MSESKKIKILFVSHSARLYGAEKNLLLLLKHIDHNCFEPVVIIPKEGPFADELRGLKIKFHKVNCPWWIRSRMRIWFFILKIFYNLIMEIYATFSLIRIISTEKPDLVYTNSMVILSGVLATRFMGKPHIWNVHEIVLECKEWQAVLPKKFYLKLVQECSQCIVTPSVASKNQFTGCLGSKKIAVVPNAVEFEELIHPDGETLKAEIKENDWPVVFIGALVQIKAPDIAIKAISHAIKTCSDLKLLIVGQGDASYENYLKELTKKLNLGNRVLFLGHRDDVWQILSRCKLALVTSRSESFGMVAVEAMAMGIPVIATRAGGLKEIITHGETGFLVSVDAPEEMAQKITELRNAPAKREQFGRNGQNCVREKYSVKKYISDIQEIIGKVLT